MSVTEASEAGLKPPFEIYNRQDIADANGHVCTAESPEFARAILAALTAAPLQEENEALRAQLDHVDRDLLLDMHQAEIDRQQAEIVRLCSLSQNNAQSWDEIVRERDRLRSRLERCEAALREVMEGKGRFSLDHFEHAKNTIEDMKEIARAALREQEQP